MAEEEKRRITLISGANALTIGGSDPSGGAGIQADIKAWQQLGVYGTSAITLLTVQNTLGVEEVTGVDPDLVIAQIEAVIEDIAIRAAKTGALGNAEMVDAVADRAKEFDFPLIVDPVMISKHGNPLLDQEAVELVRTKLLRTAFLTTPNRFEAEELVGFELVDPDSVAKAIHDIHKMGAQNVLLKLGESEGQSVHIFGTGEANHAISVPRLETKNTHGTGCALSASITGRLARGESLDKAIKISIEDVWHAIQLGQPIGAGYHPIEFRLIGFSESEAE